MDELLVATLKGKNAVKILLENHADVNKADSYESTALDWAALQGHTDIVKGLLENHADVNKAYNGLTALHWAAHQGHTDTVKVLLENHADVNQASTVGRTALHLAAKIGQTNTVTVLLNNGANHNVIDQYNKTPLDYATQHAHQATVSAIESFIVGNHETGDPSARTNDESDADETEISDITTDNGNIVNETNDLPTQEVEPRPAVSGYHEVRALMNEDRSEMLLPELVPSTNDNEAAIVVCALYKRIDDVNQRVPLPKGMFFTCQPVAITGKPNGKELSDLAQNIGFEWLRLAIELGLTDHECEQLQMSFPGDSSCWIRKMLLKWRQRAEGQSEAQRYHNLRIALKNIDRNDLAVNLK